MNLHVPTALIDTTSAFLPPGASSVLRTSRLLQGLKELLQSLCMAFTPPNAGSSHRPSIFTPGYRLSTASIATRLHYKVQ